MLYCPIFDCLSIYMGEYPRFRGYFWAILDIIVRYFEVYSIKNASASP